MHERHLSEGEVGPYTMLDIPKKTFIGYGLKNINFNNPENIDILSNILEHEELHKVLEKEIGEEATRSLDNINVPLVTDSGKIINPKTASTISLIKTQKAREIKQQNIPFEKKWKKFDEEA